MKKILLLAAGFCFLSLSLLAQALPAVDKSPMDMSYYPANYPSLKVQDKMTEAIVARVIYSRPKKEGRPVFGGIVEYGKVWRLGANEATEVEFYKPVKINGKKIAKGRYTLYAIPNENSWTLILNKETDTWGQFKYDAKKDVLRMNVPVEKTSATAESLGMYFGKTLAGFELVIGWDNIKVAMPISL